jgi:hypothetical protein
MTDFSMILSITRSSTMLAPWWFDRRQKKGSRVLTAAQRPQKNKTNKTETKAKQIESNQNQTKIATIKFTT